MKIDGRAANSGTLVINSGQKGAIDFPWGSFELVFNPSTSSQNVSLTASPPQITFDGTDNPIGISTSLSIPLMSGQQVTLNIAVYTIGDAANVTRIVHYTAA